ncbi:MAG: hypothetical protein EHM43_04345 [Ignavibacteriae bacterium]|nr:MAG: hypothetical protein EHM43_04345 [Ignavibacteriota bacterium]
MKSKATALIFVIVTLLQGCEHAVPPKLSYGMAGQGKWATDHWEIHLTLFDGVQSNKISSVLHGEMSVNQYDFDINDRVPFQQGYGPFLLYPGTETLTISLQDVTEKRYSGTVSVPTDLPNATYGEASMSYGFPLEFSPAASSDDPVELIVWTVYTSRWVPQYRELITEPGTTSARIPASVVKDCEYQGRIRVSYNRVSTTRDDTGFPAGMEITWPRASFTTDFKVAP